jgi:hypothetical protein
VPVLIICIMIKSNNLGKIIKKACLLNTFNYIIIIQSVESYVFTSNLAKNLFI